MKILRAAAFLSLVCGVVCSVYARESKLLDKGWRFTREDNAAFSQIDCNDKSWQSVTVPHDWAIYGPFSWDNDRQNVAITQDGQKEAMEHARPHRRSAFCRHRSGTATPLTFPN